MLPARSLLTPRRYWRNPRRVRRRASGRTVAYNLRFPGQIFDGQAGLHYNDTRYFDPATGNYTTSDLLGLAGRSLSTYSYANGNPVSRIDPTGQLSFLQSVIERALARAGLAEAAGLGPEDPAADVAAFVALVATIASAPDVPDSTSCPKNKPKCKEATPQNIRAVLATSTMKTLQPSVSAAVIQGYVAAIEAASPPLPIRVDDNVIVNGNHRYIAFLLCNLPPSLEPWARPLSVPPMPIQNLRIDP